MMNAKGFSKGLAIGLIGGAAAILFATPASGKQVRSSISTAKRNVQHNISQLKSDTANVTYSINTFVNEAKNNIPQIINEVKESFAKFSEDIQPETTKLKQEIETLQNTMVEFEKNLPQKKK